MKNVVVLGSTGTIGRNTLEVIRKGNGKFRVLGLACNSNTKLLKRQISEFKPGYVYVGKDGKLDQRGSFKLLSGEDGLIEIATLKKADIIIFAIPGIQSLKAAVEAVKERKVMGLATKEIMVVAGSIINKLARYYGAVILPVDSEHNAIFQILDVDRSKIEKIYLTASGGPFWGKDTKKVSLQDVLAHPVWKMGKKITVDSATMMNKAFEIIEAHYLFSLPAEKIDVLVHPEAVIHGMVEFSDGSIKGVFSPPDMKFPISFVLNYPERSEKNWGKINFGKFEKLTLVPPDKNARWLYFARKAVKEKGSYPVVMNRANEEAVKFFLKGKIKFDQILEIVEGILNGHKVRKVTTVDDIYNFDQQAKNQTLEKLAKIT
jgi:1-deoxy-D-xylulose-5-phosphate reductoisomerase